MREVVDLELFFDSMPDMIAILDTDFKIIRVNRAMAARLATTPGDCVGLTCYSTVHGTEEPPAYCPFKKLLDDKKPHNVEISEERLGGEMEVSVIPLKKESGELSGCIHIAKDITELRRSKNELEAAELRMRTIMENVPVGIFRNTPGSKGKFLMANVALARMFGFETVDEIMSVPVESLYAEPEKRKEFSDKLLATGDVNREKILLKRRDGSELTARISAKAVAGEDGDIEYFDGIIEDITVQESLRKQLIHSQKMESVGRLAGGIAHEFNNMLGVIMGNAHLALMDLKKGDAFYDEFISVMKAAERSKEITMKMLAFARKDKLVVAEINVVDIIKDITLMLDRSVSKKIEITSRTSDVYVEVDINQIQQVLLSVCNNAVDAMPGGGRLVIECAEARFERDVRIHGDTLGKGDYCRIRISDNGEGIPADILPGIFDPFYTTKETGAGTGMGLSIAHGIIENHNGRIFVDSRVGHGTDVEIFLPAVAGPSKEEESRKKQENVKHGLETILVVDDEIFILEMMGKMLFRLGYTVKLAGSGREAIDIYRESPEKIDVVILDMVMPGMGGPEVFSALKKIDPDVRVIAASGYCVGDQAEELPANGAKVFIQKPFEIQELTKAIREVLA